MSTREKTAPTELDRSHMARALELAARGEWRVSPNPKVGAVVARGERAMGEGFHREHGAPHGEIEAFADAKRRGEDVRGATLYVTLEPCTSFEGKLTPACVDAVLASGVARVVVAQRDPNPNVDGRSLERLERSGVEVVMGVLEREARLLNGPFNKWQTETLPYVTAKWAMSLDGKIASRSGDSRWISCEESRRRAHALRGEVNGVIVGIGTVLRDDPLLTRRDADGRDPARIVVDSRLRIPLESKLVKSAKEQPLLVVTVEGASCDRMRELRERGVGIVEVAEEGERVSPSALLDALARRGFQHVLVEGGGELLGSFFSHDAVDRVVCFLAPKIIGGEAPGPTGGLDSVDKIAQACTLSGLVSERSGDDVVITGYVHEW